jgi:hypothetical protein
MEQLLTEMKANHEEMMVEMRAWLKEMKVRWEVTDTYP